MQFAEVKIANNVTGIQIIPLIPNHEVMYKETEDDKYFNNTENMNAQTCCQNQKALLATIG